MKKGSGKNDIEQAIVVCVDGADPLRASNLLPVDVPHHFVFASHDGRRFGWRIDVEVLRQAVASRKERSDKVVGYDEFLSPRH